VSVREEEMLFAEGEMIIEIIARTTRQTTVVVVPLTGMTGVVTEATTGAAFKTAGLIAGTQEATEEKSSF